MTTTHGLRGLRAIALLAWGTLLSCASAPPRGACPESRSVRCVTAMECEYQAQRECMICRCAPPPYVRPTQALPTTP